MKIKLFTAVIFTYSSIMDAQASGKLNNFVGPGVQLSDTLPQLQTFKDESIDTVLANFKTKSLLIKLKDNTSYEYQIGKYKFNDLQNLASKITDAANIISKIYTRAQKMPQFPGGQQSWEDYIKGFCLKRQTELTGKVPYTATVQFIVDQNGDISEVAAVNGNGDRLSRLAIEAMSNSPRWLPAVQSGSAVVCYQKQIIVLNL